MLSRCVRIGVLVLIAILSGAITIKLPQTLAAGEGTPAPPASAEMTDVNIVQIKSAQPFATAKISPFSFTDVVIKGSKRTVNAFDYELFYTPVISYDGSKIVFIIKYRIDLEYMLCYDMNTRKINIIEGKDNGLVDDPQWDPLDNDMLYINYSKKEKYRIWKIRYDGSGANEIFPERDATMEKIVGKHLIYNRPEDDRVVLVVRSLLDGNEEICEYNQYKILCNYSPNEKYSAYWDADITKQYSFIVFQNILNQRVIPIFSRDQLMLEYPPQDRRVGVHQYWWLPDSSGILMNTSILHADGNRTFQTWQISTNGEVRKLWDNLRVLASSNDGKHWLIGSSDGKLYRVSL